MTETRRKEIESAWIKAVSDFKALVESGRDGYIGMCLDTAKPYLADKPGGFYNEGGRILVLYGWKRRGWTEKDPKTGEAVDKETPKPDYRDVYKRLVSIALMKDSG